MNPPFKVFKVALLGACGKMGRETANYLSNFPEEFALSGLVARNKGGQPHYFESLEELLQNHIPDIVIDLTDAHSVKNHCQILLNHPCHVLVGASGLSNEELQELEKKIHERGKRGSTSQFFVIPNFSIGAVLMIKFSSEAARFFQGGDILEIHHRGKKDKPSGTALKTATEMERAKSLRKPEVLSLRLDGVLAEQWVFFGGQGETLRIGHSSIDRSSFMPGILLCLRELTRPGKPFVYGMEKLLFPSG